MADEAEYGYETTEPSTDRLARARHVLALHRRVFVPEPVCNWCLTRFPCSEAGWALRVLRRGEVDGASR